MFVPQRWFNAYRGERDKHQEPIAGVELSPSTLRKGDLQVHFAGPKKTKAHMPYYQDIAEKRDPEWELPLDRTSYPEEISAFWREKSTPSADNANEKDLPGGVELTDEGEISGGLPKPFRG